MFKRLLAIGFIFGCTSIAWMILGSTLFARTYSSDSSLKASVEKIWGKPQSQVAPTASYAIARTREEESLVNGAKVSKQVKYFEHRALALVASNVKVKLGLDHRQKGLLWYATYAVDFAATYQFQNDSGEDRTLRVAFPFPSQTALYDDIRFEVHNGRWATKPEVRDGSLVGSVQARAGQTVTVEASYRSQGLDQWMYRFTSNEERQKVSEVRNFRLEMETDFDGIDFPLDTVSPTRKEKTTDGWRLAWEYGSLISGVNIGMSMPQKLQPGPLAGQISFFAPVSLFFFILVMLVIALVRRIDLHPVHFFFLAAAFFAFHLLLAYLVDHISLHAAFLVAAAVSVALVVSYLRLVVGPRFAFIEAAAAQLIYLVAFSYAFFFKGFTGLAVTIGAILTLFVLMQMTAHIRWADVFAKKA
jgi:inner membrane protein involved in colicin E2 resistance